MHKRTVFSLDLAKRIIQVCKISKHGEVLFNKPMSPAKVRALLANSSPAIVAMEGCGSFHYWGRFAEQCGHEVRGMPPHKVKPYVSKQKTDPNDCIGIGVAATQLGMTFCPVKSLSQQSLQSVNTSRKFLDKSMTALGNHIRALCYEYGVTIAKGAKGLRVKAYELMETDDGQLPNVVKTLLSTLWAQYLELDKQLKSITRLIKEQVKQSEPCQRLMALEGVGEIGAAGLVCSLGDGRGFKSGRDASVYIGATPKQHSSGGKVTMVGIRKHGGDKTLRAVLYQGALSVISRLPEKAKTQKQQWLLDLVARAGIKRACIALVNKTIRTAWALLRYNSTYQAANI